MTVVILILNRIAVIIRVINTPVAGILAALGTPDVYIYWPTQTSSIMLSGYYDPDEMDYFGEGKSFITIENWIDGTTRPSYPSPNCKRYSKARRRIISANTRTKPTRYTPI
jgi:hypothetical protein